jgi:hypothetical protein
VTNPSDVARPDEVGVATYLEFSQNRSPPPMLDINVFERHLIPLDTGTSALGHRRDNARRRRRMASIIEADHRAGSALIVRVSARAVLMGVHHRLSGSGDGGDRAAFR